MRFEPRIKRFTNPIGRRESRTLLMLIMLLGFMVVVIGQAMKPETWAWFFDRGASAEDQQTQVRDDDTVPETRVKVTPSKPEFDDQFTLRIAEPPAAEPEPEPEQTPGFFPGVRPELLSSIEENLEFNDDELEPRMNLLGVLKNADQKDLDKASTGVVGFLQLHKQSSIYRGKLVTVVGSARQGRFVASTVKDGVEQYFEITLKPKGGPPRPILIYCLEKPKGFPEGSKIDEPVRITGFYFKKRNYQAQDDRRLAPAIFAKSFRWKPAKKEASWDLTSQQIAWMFGGAAAFAVLVVMIVHFRTRKLFASRREQEATLALAEEQVLPSVGEQLANMGDEKNR